MRKIVKKSAPKSKPKSTRRAASRIVTKSKSSSFPYKPVIIALAVFGLLYMGYRTLFRPAPVGINQVTGGSGVVTLSLDPPDSTITSGPTREITLKINAGAYHASIAKIDILYDPEKCKEPSVTKGGFLTEQPPIGTTTIRDGHIKFIYTTALDPSPLPNEIQGVTGEGILAKITTGPKNDTCELTFNPGMDGEQLANEVWVTDPGYDSVQQLASASDAIIRLPGASIEPSPSLAPSPSPSVTPSSTPSGSCPSNYTPAMCQAYLQARKEKETSTQSVVSRVKECMKSQSFSYCTSKTFLSCSSTKPVAECLP